MSKRRVLCRDIFRVDGKVAVVTGGAGILGKGYCAALAEMGAKVVVSDLDAELCKSLAQEIDRSTGGCSFGLSVNLAEQVSVRDWANRILDKFGHVDILVNNAATKPEGFFTPLDEYSLRTWNEVMAVNLTGVFLTVRELGPSMAAGSSGSIINVSSIYGIVGPDQRIYEGSWYESLGGAINTPLAYSASKSAIVGLSRHLATYWGPYNVRVNCLVPGGVESGQNDEFIHRYAARVPLGRMAKAEEMIGALLFLASDASTYVTGHVLVVDGGLSAW
jgi:NAD(P)-dependent dehydrogenase (short-subunit alcohol dehydrogenase family)